MILKFRHKGLEKLFSTGKASAVKPDHRRKLRLILAQLNASISPKDMDLPGLGLHSLKGEYKGFYSVSVNGNWRVIFRFEGKNATEVNCIDYRLKGMRHGNV